MDTDGETLQSGRTFHPGTIPLKPGQYGLADGKARPRWDDTELPVSARRLQG